jgi:hypothetical protein
LGVGAGTHLHPPNVARRTCQMRRLWVPVFGVIVAALGLIPSQPALPAGTPGRYAVIIVLDGARPGYFNLAPMPNLRALIRRGAIYTQAFTGQELANTPPSHATIGTGMLPKHHGVEGFLWEDPQTGQVTNPTQTGAVQSGALEQVIADHHVPTLAGRIHAASPGAKVASVSAHKCYAADAMGTPTADYILCALIYHNRWVAQAIGNHRPPPGAINNPAWDVPIPPRTSGFGAAVQQWKMGTENDWTTRYALWAFERVHYPRLMMINLSETDVLGHFASNASTATYLMKEFDRLLGQIEDSYRKAGLLDRTDFIITADHGMSRIHAFLPYKVLTDSVAQAGTTATYIEHDTAASIGLADPSKARQVARTILTLGGSEVDATYFKAFRHGRWGYYLAASQSGISPALRGAYRRLANTMAAAAGPDVFAVFAPHVSTRDFSAYGYAWRAGHLGPQWDDQHIPLVIAGPGIRAGTRSAYPARLVDIAPTVEALLGANYRGVDGVVLQDGLQQRIPGAETAQRRRAAVLTPVIHLLENRSGKK